MHFFDYDKRINKRNYHRSYSTFDYDPKKPKRSNFLALFNKETKKPPFPIFF